MYVASAVGGFHRIRELDLDVVQLVEMDSVGAEPHTVEYPINPDANPVPDRELVNNRGELRHHQQVPERRRDIRGGHTCLADSALHDLKVFLCVLEKLGVIKSGGDVALT